MTLILTQIGALEQSHIPLQQGNRHFQNIIPKLAPECQIRPLYIRGKKLVQMNIISSQIRRLRQSYSYLQIGNRSAKFEALSKVCPKARPKCHVREFWTQGKELGQMALISSQLWGSDQSYSLLQKGNGWARSKTLLKVSPKAHPRMPYQGVLESRQEIGLDDLNLIPNWSFRLDLLSPSRGQQMGKKLHPKTCPRMPYQAILESRQELGIDELNFIPNWRFGIELLSSSEG